MMKEISESLKIYCRFCKSQDIDNIDSNFIICNKCDCIFNQNFNDEKNLLLDNNIQTPNSVFSTMSNPIKMRFWDLISKEYVKYLKEKTDMKFKTALDVGALYGHLVKRLNDLEIITNGIEVEQNYIDNCVSSNVYHGYFDEHFQSDVKYDLICLTQMIYYAKNPYLVIKKTVELLNHSGMLFISTQNPTSPIIKQQKTPIFENGMNILLSKKNFQSIVDELNLKLIDFTNFRPNIYLDRLNNTGIKSEFINFLKYHKKPAYETNLNGHHSFLLLKKI